MKISAEIVGVESRISDNHNINGNMEIVLPSTYELQFFSPDAIIRLEISERSKLYEHLAMFRHTKGKHAQFIFDIGGDNVDDYYGDLIRKHTKELTEAYGKINLLKKDLANTITDKIDIELDFDAIKNKWWYKLFTYFN